MEPINFFAPLGKLTKDATIPEWYRSEPIMVPFFGGKKIPLVLELKNGASAELFDKMREVVENFLKLDEKYRDDVSGEVFANYETALKYSDIEPLEIEEKTDVWKYVRPDEVYVREGQGDDKKIYAMAMCDCEWEEEHGLQLVFQDGKKLTRVSEQDCRLTDPDPRDYLDEEPVSV